MNQIFSKFLNILFIFLLSFILSFVFYTFTFYSFYVIFMYKYMKKQKDNTIKDIYMHTYLCTFHYVSDGMIFREKRWYLKICSSIT